jgi:hypothetical protein
MGMMGNVSPELALLLVLYGMHLSGCIHWVGPGQAAVVWGGREGWVRRAVTTGSYTLLGRMPVMRNPLSVRGGFARVSAAATIEDVRAKLRGVERRTKWLAVAAGVSGVYLLVLLPAGIELGLLGRWWKPLLGMLVGLHLLVVVEFFACTGAWRRRQPGTFWQTALSVGLSPVGAIRAADAVVGWKAGVVLRS